MSDDYLWDRSGKPDPEVEQLEKLLSPLGHDAPLAQLRPRRRVRWIIASSVVAAAAAAVVLVVALPRGSEPPPCRGSGFLFVAHGGAVTCSGAQVATGVLPVGGVLDTGGHEADLDVADIGQVELGPNTKITLDQSDETRHHLLLDHGHLHARVNAPPRLFAVSTRSTDVVDLGCAYTIDADHTGAGKIHVELGKVELATRSGAIVVAPRNTHAAILAGNQPGLPVVDGASQDVEAAVVRGDFETLIAAARPEDAITLVNLAVVDPARRRAAVTRLDELVTAPAGVTRDTAIADPYVLERWRDDIVAATAARP